LSSADWRIFARGADGVLYFFWRQPLVGSEKFYGGVLTHDGRGDNRVYKEISQIDFKISYHFAKLCTISIVFRVNAQILLSF